MDGTAARPGPTTGLRAALAPGRRGRGRHRGGLPGAPGDGLRRGGRAGSGRRAVGDHGVAAGVRVRRIVAPALGRAGVDDLAHDRGASPAGGRDPARYADLAAALAVSWASSASSGGGRLGFLADLLSKPVLIGYMAGVAVHHDHRPARQADRCVCGRRFGRRRAPVVLGGSTRCTGRRWCLALAVLAFLLVAAGCSPRAGAAIGMLLATAAVVVFASRSTASRSSATSRPGSRAAGARRVDERPRRAAAAGRRRGDRRLHRQRPGPLGRSPPANRLHGRRQPGAAGAGRREPGARAWSRGFPVSSSGSRTVIGDRWAAGARSTRWSRSSVVAGHAAVPAVPARHFPTAALGAVVVYAAVRLVDVAEFRRIARSGAASSCSP